MGCRRVYTVYGTGIVGCGPFYLKEDDAVAAREISLRRGCPLIQLGKIVLHSGSESNYKLECDEFIRNNLEGLAWMISQVVGRFTSVVGVPRGGLLLAKELEKYISKDAGENIPNLIVDDVLTTGKSMEQQAKDGKHNIGAVVFARGKCPGWIRPLFTLNPSLWEK